MPIVRVWLAICLASAGHDTQAKIATEEIFKFYPNFHIAHCRQFRWKDSEVRERAAGIWNGIVSP